ncbi:cell division protein ZapE [uncultured Dechloromonas sp.]|uniref:cell division protein ZapE n=1 Tax=uncultured Dechloromonas sp. TaxID=171719 RepID=UPI0025EE1611|nr:cell division protein ZapE [uncultured Dechloromonas sp.]
MAERNDPGAILRHFSLGGIEPDPAQRLVAQQLARLLAAVTADAGQRASGRGGRGIFLWGGVGRGKTRLVDAAVAALPPGLACRWHQLAFLDAFHRAFAGPARHDFAAAIDRLVGQARLLAFDEFHIHDIADAQILRRAFGYLATRGVRLLVTANPPPAGFAAEGERQRHFAPLIEHLSAWCESIELDGGVDYRRLHRPLGQRWVAPDTAAARVQLMVDLENISPRIATASFDDLCRRPRCHGDYARQLDAASALALWNVPRFGERDGDALRRLVWLADVLWERQVPLAITAAETAESIFLGIGDALRRMLGRDLARAESRLIALSALSAERPTAASAGP